MPYWNRKCYLDLINACVPEEEMFDATEPLTSPPPLQRLPDEIESQLSPQERKSVWYTLKLREVQAHEDGRQAGRQEALATMLATLWDTLAQRNIDLDAQHRARLEQCRDAALLLRLLVRAATATSVADLQLD